MSVSSDGSHQASFAAALVDEFVRGGAVHAVICPGSRSAPLALALAGRSELTTFVRLDERSAGFFALGLSKVTGRPTIVCTTSGTAAAELHAAVVEAHYGRVPLLVCTADRPPELQGVGAPQTIDQTQLFGHAVRAFVSSAGEGGEETWRSIGARAYLESMASPFGPGPVHLNLHLREPLVAVPGPLQMARPNGAPFHGVARWANQVIAGTLPVERWRGQRGVLVVGEGGGARDLVLQAGEALGWPVLADPRSGCRVKEPGVVAAADAILRSPSAAARLAPEVVVRLGAPWASKVLAGFMKDAAAGGCQMIGVDPWWRWQDPDRLVDLVESCTPDAWLRAVINAAGGPLRPSAWRSLWQRHEEVAQAAIDDVVSLDTATREGTLSEPAVARHLGAMLPANAWVLVSSSMPVRDLEWYGTPSGEPPSIRANRGANGIDGICSTAFGMAAATDDPVVALVGDLAFFHDVSALVGSRGLRGVLVVLDNGGGGIFSFLAPRAQVGHAEFETLFATPQGNDVGAVAEGFGLTVARVSDLSELSRALESLLGAVGPSVIHVKAPERDDNVALHERIHDAVAEALDSLDAV